MFDDLLDGLNSDQREAVLAPTDKHMLVLAGAGCGKTAVLTRRIAYLTRTGVPSERICALTFTKKAALEMAARVKLVSGCSDKSAPPLITTFHGYALGVLKTVIEGKSNFERIGFSSFPELISQNKRLEILAGISTSQERQILQTDLPGLDALMEKIAVFPEKLQIEYSDRITLLQSMFHRFNRAKKDSGGWTFTDLISGVLDLFCNYPGIVEICMNQNDAILVDEFQDTNPAQIQVLKYMLGQKNVLFAVGDDDQAIYGFRGADIQSIVNFETIFANAKICKLQVNYRSVPAILSAANKIFSDKPAKYRKVLSSGKFSKSAQGKRPSRHSFPDQDSMAMWILAQAQCIASKEKIAIEEMAVLFRLNQSLKSLHLFLEKNVSGPVPQLFTIHGSKGLEYPVVFLCDLEEGVFPNYRIPKGCSDGSLISAIKSLFAKDSRVPQGCDLDEEKRLFYVGVTRAQRYLYLLSAKSKLVYARKRSFELSRFLKLV